MFTSKNLPFVVCLLTTLVFGSVSIATARANSRNYPMPSAGLIVVPETNLRLIDGNQADYDYGRVNSLDTERMEHRFTLRNDGTKPVTITQFQPSCHCTTVIVEQISGRQPNATEETNPTVLPGLEMVIKVTVQLARQPAGALSQGVYIFALGHDGPVARVHIQGELATGLAVTPSALDFGPVKIGETKTQPITITFDQRLVPGGNLPAIEVQADPRQESDVSLIKVTSAPESTSSNSAKAAPGVCAKTYLVSIRPEHTGDIAARLYFTPLNASAYNGSIPYDTAMDTFHGMTVSVFATAVEK